MNQFIVLCLVIAAAVGEGYASSYRIKRQVIPKEFANLNLDNYFNNERAVKFQFKCILDDGPCDRLGKYMKAAIPEVLHNFCDKCEADERDKAGKLVRKIQESYPEEWDRSVKKFTSGMISAEDALKFETNLGVKIDPKYIEK